MPEVETAIPNWPDLAFGYVREVEISKLDVESRNGRELAALIKHQVELAKNHLWDHCRTLGIKPASFHLSDFVRPPNWDKNTLVGMVGLVKVVYGERA